MTASSVHSAVQQAIARALRGDSAGTAAALLIGTGLDLKAVQARLGHSTIAVTMQPYVHADKANDRLAAKAIEHAKGARPRVA